MAMQRNMLKITLLISAIIFAVLPSFVLAKSSRYASITIEAGNIADVFGPVKNVIYCDKAVSGSCPYSDADLSGRIIQMKTEAGKDIWVDTGWMLEDIIMAITAGSVIKAHGSYRKITSKGISIDVVTIKSEPDHFIQIIPVK